MRVTDILNHSATPTPLFGNVPGIFVKMEAFGVAGSHKSRAARYALRQAIRAGHVFPGGQKRIIEKTGGNFGLGLAYYAGQVNIGVDLVVGNSFSPTKKRVCQEYGANLIGQKELNQGMSPKEVIASIIQENPNKYYFLDQFNNDQNLYAHVEETGPELVQQLQRQGISKSANLILVAGAGTGASITGLSIAVREAFLCTQVFLAYPDACDPLLERYEDHPIEGVAVGINPPFLNKDLISGFIPVSPKRAAEGQRICAKNLGVYCGISSGMNIWAACSLLKKNPFSTIVTIAYDTGDAYIRSPDVTISS